MKGSTFNQAMAPNCYQLLLELLHIANNNFCGPQNPSHDRFYKVRPVVDFLLRI